MNMISICTRAQMQDKIIIQKLRLLRPEPINMKWLVLEWTSVNCLFMTDDQGNEDEIMQLPFAFRT